MSGLYHVAYLPPLSRSQLLRLLDLDDNIRFETTRIDAIKKRLRRSGVDWLTLRESKATVRQLLNRFQVRLFGDYAVIETRKPLPIDHSSIVAKDLSAAEARAKIKELGGD